MTSHQSTEDFFFYRKLAGKGKNIEIKLIDSLSISMFKSEIVLKKKNKNQLFKS